MNTGVSPEQIRAAFSRIPRPLREFIAEGELLEVVQRIALEHQLHDDLTGALMQLMTNVLLGFIDPASLPQELSKTIGLPNEQVSDFIKELNDQIFIPLQKRVREAGEEPNKEERLREAAEENARPAASGTSHSAQDSVQAYRSMPTAASIPPPNISVPAPAPALLTPPSPVAPLPPSYNLIQPKVPINATPAIPPVVPATVSPESAATVRTMSHDMDAVQHGALPTPYPASFALPGQPHPSQMTPAMAFQTASVPFTSMPAPSRPIVSPAPPVSPPSPAPASPKQPTSTSDPYREPI